MNRIVSQILFTVMFTVGALALVAQSASAAIITTVTHDYGSGPGKYAPPSSGAGTCDTLNADTVTIRDSSGCQRFYDLFDFSAASYTSISGLELSLTFDSTNQVFAGFFPEDWRVRPAISPSLATTVNSEMPALTRSGTVVTQTFMFDSSNLSIFNTIVMNEVFGLWFAENALGANNFNLHTASLTVHGEPDDSSNVPEPASLLMLGMGMLGSVALRRRQQRQVRQ